MNQFRADLHCHSTCSDGTMLPQELVEYAIKIGLKGLSITDHDSIEAYKQIAPSNGLLLIPGAEFSAVLDNTNVHILAYSFSPRSRIIELFSERHLERRLERNRAIFSLLKKNKMPLEEVDLEKICKGMPGRPHIAQAMIEKGYVSSMSEAFKKFLGEDKSCYSPGARISVEETLGVIHEAGALAVIAHPHLIKRNKVVKKLLEMPFDGIEAYYAKFSGYNEQKWVNIAQEKGMLVTGGSDFHGEIKQYNPLGCSWTNEETFKILRDRYLSNEKKLR